MEYLRAEGRNRLALWNAGCAQVTLESLAREEREHMNELCASVVTEIHVRRGMKMFVGVPEILECNFFLKNCQAGLNGIS